MKEATVCTVLVWTHLAQLEDLPPKLNGATVGPGQMHIFANCELHKSSVNNYPTKQQKSADSDLVIQVVA